MKSAIASLWPLRTHLLFLTLITATVILANAPLLSGFVNCDPESRCGGIAAGFSPGLLHIPACFVDPGPAYYTQPMGRLSAWDWLHGIVPWWNHFSGIGMPLAAEMQNESFFLPFVLLLIFHSGWLIQRIVFQLLGGLLTYAFMVELRCSRLASFTAAALFALNGTFFLTAGTVVGPLFCLPLLLIGIEHVARAAANEQRMGWSLVVLAVTLSLYSGFPEIAYLDSLLGACWAILRIVQAPARARWRLLLKLCLGAGVGIALALPQLVPFIEYVKLGNVGVHNAATATSVWPMTAAPVQLFRFFYGALGLQSPPALSQSFGNLWVRIGGWFGMLPMLLALAALLAKSPKQRGMRLILGLWILLWEGRCFGCAYIIKLCNLIPGMTSADAPRYSGASVEFAVFVLAACGLDALRTRQLGRWRLGLLLGVFGGITIAAVVPVVPFMTAWYHAYPKARVTGIGLSALAALSALGWLIMLTRGRGAVAASGWMVSAALVTMIIPQLGAPRGGVEILNSVTALQSRINLDRAYALGAFSGPYWASRRIASINYIQLPAPETWVDYIREHLYVDADAQLFRGTGPGQMQAFATNMPAYEELGVHYLSVPAGTSLPAMAGQQMQLVAHDAVLDIWALPHPAPYAEAQDCVLKLATWQQMDADCAGPSTLLRRELFYPGWHASVNGHAVPLTMANDIFQQIPLPAGHSSIHFSYLPTHMRAACAVALAALMLWLGAAIMEARRLIVRTPASSPASPAAAPAPAPAPRPGSAHRWRPGRSHPRPRRSGRDGRWRCSRPHRPAACRSGR